VKDVLQKVAIEYRDHVAETAMGIAEESLQAFVDGGGTVVELSPEARAAWANAMPNIAAEWAAELDGAGAPGSEMLIAYIDKLKAAGQEPVRDWAAELAN
jgi:TRAP-type C4-dicarboxylate transport system substrate-binding protein